NQTPLPLRIRDRLVCQGPSLRSHAYAHSGDGASIYGGDFARGGERVDSSGEIQVCPLSAKFNERRIESQAGFARRRAIPNGDLPSITCHKWFKPILVPVPIRIGLSRRWRASAPRQPGEGYRYPGDARGHRARAVRLLERDRHPARADEKACALTERRIDDYSFAPAPRMRRGGCQTGSHASKQT